MRVLVMDVRHVSAAVKNPELEMIVDVTVIDVRRIVRVIRPGCLDQGRQGVRKPGR